MIENIGVDTINITGNCNTFTGRQDEIKNGFLAIIILCSTKGF